MKLLVALLVAFVGVAHSATDKVVCYWGTWAAYRPGNGNFNVNDIDANLCTHIIYSFVGLGSDGTIRLLDSSFDKDGFYNLVSLKKTNAALKVLVAMGGWNEGSSTYSVVINSPELRTKLINNIVTFCKKYALDGFDLDWEYPGARGGQPTDRIALTEFLRLLRSRFNIEKLLLSAAVSANKAQVQISYDVPALSNYLDFINVMAYDFSGPWESKTGHNAPIRGALNDPTPDFNVQASIDFWISAGANPQKIVLGVGAYGHSFTLLNSAVNGVGAPVTGAGQAGPYTQEPGMLTYLEICEQQKQSGWTVKWDDNKLVPYAFRGLQWVSYDNIQSIEMKGNYARNRNLGGVMVWSIESDDVRNSCGNGKYPIINTLKRAAFGISPPITTVKPSTIASITTTTSKPATNNATTWSPSSTTVVNPPANRACPTSGFYRDPTNCSHFVRCFLQGSQYAFMSFSCPSGLYFDETVNSCNWPSQVKC